MQLQLKANYYDDDDFNDNYHYSNNYFDYDGEKMTKNIQYFFGVMSFSFARSQKINILWNPPAASFSPNL